MNSTEISKSDNKWTSKKYFMKYDDSLFLYFSKIVTSILNKEIRFLKFY